MRLHVAKVHRPLLGHALFVGRYPAVCVFVDVHLETFVVSVVTEYHFAEHRLVRHLRHNQPRRVAIEIDVRQLRASLKASRAQPRQRFRELDRRKADAVRECSVAYCREARPRSEGDGRKLPAVGKRPRTDLADGRRYLHVCDVLARNEGCVIDSPDGQSADIRRDCNFPCVRCVHQGGTRRVVRAHHHIARAGLASTSRIADLRIVELRATRRRTRVDLVRRIRHGRRRKRQQRKRFREYISHGLDYPPLQVFLRHSTTPSPAASRANSAIRATHSSIDTPKPPSG